MGVDVSGRNGPKMKGGWGSKSPGEDRRILEMGVSPPSPPS